jgi:hypothetical protein
VQVALSPQSNQKQAAFSKSGLDAFGGRWRLLAGVKMVSLCVCFSGRLLAGVKTASFCMFQWAFDSSLLPLTPLTCWKFFEDSLIASLKTVSLCVFFNGCCLLYGVKVSFSLCVLCSLWFVTCSSWRVVRNKRCFTSFSCCLSLVSVYAITHLVLKWAALRAGTKWVNCGGELSKASSVFSWSASVVACLLVLKAVCLCRFVCCY